MSSLMSVATAAIALLLSFPQFYPAPVLMKEDDQQVIDWAILHAHCCEMTTIKREVCQS